MNNIQNKSTEGINVTQSVDAQEVKVVKKNNIKVIVVAIIFVILLIILLSFIAIYSLDIFNLRGTTGECKYNGQTYVDGQNFDAEDGCNTCLCNGNTGEVFCTEIDCDINQSTNEINNNTSTPEVEPVNTNNNGWKTYASTIYDYSLQYPETVVLSTPEECNASGTSHGPCNSAMIRFEDLTYPEGTIEIQSSEIFDYNTYIQTIKNYSWRSDYNEKTFSMDGYQAQSIEGFLPMTPDGSESNDSYAQYIFVSTNKFTHTIFIWDNKQRVNQENIGKIINSFDFD